MSHCSGGGVGVGVSTHPLWTHPPPGHTNLLGNTHPLERTWYQRYPSPGKDMGPEIPNLPVDGQTPVKTLPSLSQYNIFVACRLHNVPTCLCLIQTEVFSIILISRNWLRKLINEVNIQSKYTWRV